MMIATHLDKGRFESSLGLSRWPPTASSYVDPTAASALEAVDAAGVTIVPLHRRRKVELAAWMRLSAYLREHRVDVLHTHKFGSNVWGALAGRAAQVPVIVAHEHTWSYTGQPLRRLLDRHVVARMATQFVAVSTEDRRRMIEVERIAPDKTLYVPNGVSMTPPTPGRNIRKELGIAADANVIGIVAVLRPQKAHAVLLRAAAELVADWPDLCIVLAGDGPDAAALRQLAVDLGIAASVRLIGSRTDVPDVLRSFDIAVCCSDFEGSPLAVMEYMAAGLPIVATAVGGVPDIITSETHGLLVPPQDPPALASALRRLLDDRELAARLGEQAQARQRTEFELTSLVGRLEALYVELLEQQRGANTATPPPLR